MKIRTKTNLYELVFLMLILTTAGFAQTLGVDRAKLLRLIERGRETHSDGLVVIQDGKILAEEYFGKPKGAVYLASAGKSLLALAIGKLLDEGKIKSLDQPVSDFYPEWLQGNKKLITIRMLMNHTSGIQNVANATVEIERKNPPVNAIKLALAAELSDKPGANWSYNNKAVGLLGGIIEKASGKKMESYFAESFYKPMDIRNYDWIRDEDGNPTAYGAFSLEPMDLAKFGLLMLGNGKYEGRQIVSESFVGEALKPSQTLFPAGGLLWWRYPKFSKSLIDDEKFAELRRAGVGEDFLRKIEPLRNVDFQDNQTYFAAAEKALGKNWREQINKAFEGVTVTLRKRVFSDEIVAYYAAGFRGNYLIVIPKAKLVAVRVVRNDDDYNFDTDGFQDFLKAVVELTGETAGSPPIG